MQHYNGLDRGRVLPGGTEAGRLMRGTGTSIGCANGLPQQGKYQTDQEIIDSRILRRETHMMSRYEDIFKAAFAKKGLDVMYEPFTLIVPKNSTGACEKYVPDFVMLDNTMNGKPIIIEPHSAELINVRYLNRVHRAKDMYNFYMILCTTEEFYDTSSCSASKALEYVDELWVASHIPFKGIRDVAMNIDSLKPRTEPTSRSTVMERIMRADVRIR